MEIILSLAVIAQWAYFKVTLADVKATREAWHAETKGKVTDLERRQDEAEKHIIICENDRIKLSFENQSLIREMETLKMMVATYRSCNATECPLKQSK